MKVQMMEEQKENSYDDEDDDEEYECSGEYDSQEDKTEQAGNNERSQSFSQDQDILPSQ